MPTNVETDHPHAPVPRLTRLLLDARGAHTHAVQLSWSILASNATTPCIHFLPATGDLPCAAGAGVWDIPPPRHTGNTVGGEQVASNGPEFSGHPLVKGTP